METKICTKCGKELPIEDFNWRSKENGTRRSECKTCHTNFMKEIYENKKKTVSEIKKNLKCAKCGEEREYCLDFHHVDPNEKENTIARMTSNNYRLDTVLDEIKKCIVLCSNCHREFHYFQEQNGTTIKEYLSGGTHYEFPNQGAL